MDLLKAELERKRRAVAGSSSLGGGGGGGEKKRYMTASERRRRLELEEEEEEEGTNGRRRRREEDERRRKKIKRRRRRRRRDGVDDDDDDDDDDDGVEEEDLTTMITRRYDPSFSSRGGKDGGVGGGGEAGARHASSSSSGAGGTKAVDAIDNNGGGSSRASREDAAAAGGDGSAAAAAVLPGSLARLTPGGATAALREFGLPVRLFGENGETARLYRLAEAVRGREATELGESERDEFLLDSANRTRNVFLERDRHHGTGEDDGTGGGMGGGYGDDDHRDDDDGRRKRKSSSSVLAAAKGGGGGGAAPAGAAAPPPAAAAAAAPMTEEELNDKPKRIYRYFKSLIRQWEDDLSRRPDAIRRTAAGKNETKTLKQCKDYIRPLFHLCKRRELEGEIRDRLFDIVVRCEIGEFVRAHDAYMDVAIGRAAWPIGVTMVGIHARSGRAKIESSNVAHMMNSEVNRKYLTSVKRLMSYAQKKRPDVHPSKKVTNV